MNQVTRIRKSAATIANRINGKIHDLAAAFRRAWQEDSNDRAIR